MFLYAVTRKEELRAVRELSWAYYKTGGMLHVNGRKENTTWYVYPPVKKLLFTEAVPAEQTGGDCMAQFGTSTNPEMRSVDCFNANYWSYCQWDLVSMRQTCTTGKS
jgi:hypothetical protein